jgi:YegS/Rv2252/BmrU family lipid kinase
LKNAILLHNPLAGGRSGRREKQLAEAARVFEKAGWDVSLRVTAGLGSARELARQAPEAGADLVLVCGGDGTINEVVNGLAPGKVPLGILPGGTANVFARELHVPLQVVRAAQALTAGSFRRIALGRACWSNSELALASAQEQRFFLSLAGVGLDAYIIHKLSREFARALGIFAYGWEGLRQVLRYGFAPFLCRLGDREIRVTFAAVHRAQRYAGWVRMAPGADVFGDRLSVCTFTSRARARYFLYAAAVLTGRHLRLGDVELIETRSVECLPASPETVYFELDGELVGSLPVRFDVVPNALTLLVPSSKALPRPIASKS